MEAQRLEPEWPERHEAGDRGDQNLDLWKEIDAKLNASTGLTIAWVKGRNGTVGN
ncbi:hypothetical protein K9B32_20855 [Rhizobium sp. 3T7]|uniref:hypothetical protein n=1 Tax=Rhizobium sp. 3T7 TaxID=2874922 RepID=UPI001CCE0BB9|nr:hypothetical protein [Rhizobium sp. 3T7]MBZ9792535.1 hypothetical protein [Rhizobium sp. 3T7]